MEFFDNVKLYLDKDKGNAIVPKFVCSECGKEFDKEDMRTYRIPCDPWGAPLIPKVYFVCKECAKNDQ